MFHQEACRNVARAPHSLVCLYQIIATLNLHWNKNNISCKQWSECVSNICRWKAFWERLFFNAVHREGASFHVLDSVSARLVHFSHVKMKTVRSDEPHMRYFIRSSQGVNVGPLTASQYEVCMQWNVLIFPQKGRQGCFQSSGLQTVCPKRRGRPSASWLWFCSIDSQLQF